MLDRHPLLRIIRGLGCREIATAEKEARRIVFQLSEYVSNGRVIDDENQFLRVHH